MPAHDPPLELSHDEATLHFYADHVPTYSASGPGGASRHLGLFLRALHPGSRILELGCGGGRDAQAMIAAGHDVDATDAAPAIARQAEALLGRSVRVMRFDELEAEHAYDAVWANAALLHVPRCGLAAILARVHRALRPGGLHYASFKAGEGEGRDRHGRYFNYPDRDALLAAYETAGRWRVEFIKEYVGGGYDPGATGFWLAIMVRRVG